MSATDRRVLIRARQAGKAAMQLFSALILAFCALVLAAVPAQAQSITGSSVTPSTFSGSGQTITFTVTVNSGNRVASSATVASNIGAVYSCPIADTTNTGVTFTCTANYTTTASDVSSTFVQERPTVTLLSFATPTIMIGPILQSNFVAPPSPPTVTGLSPTTGPTAGGTSVTISGTNFTGASAVSFGANAATSFIVNSASSITATSPAGTGTVDVRVTTGGGTSATSAADQFTYSANIAPSITANPASITVVAGSNASFAASASGTPTPTVQWQLSTDGGASFGNIAGATSTTLTLSSVTAGQSGQQYRAVFTNSQGTANTSAATLTVNTPPSVTTNPISQTVNAGGSVSFAAAASGSPTPTVQWQQSTDGGANFGNISGATSTTLSFTALSGQNGNQYRAVFTSTAGTATTTAATLTVNTAPVVSTNPANTSLDVGQTASFSAAASGVPTPTVQWQLSTDGGANFGNIAGATSTSLSVSGVTFAQNGQQFRAVFTNAAGTATTTAATMTVNKLAQTITVTSAAPGSAQVAGTTYSPAATATSTLTVAIAIDPSASGVCSITSGVVSFLSTGTCTVNFNQAGDATYLAAPQVQQSIAVGPGANLIDFAVLPDRALGSGDFTVSATASSGLTVTFSTTTGAVCSVNGTTVSLLAVGTCTINADQAGNGNYQPAAQIGRSFQVTRSATAVALVSSAPTAFFGMPLTLTATVTGISPTGTVSFSDGATVLGTSPLNGTTATFTTSSLSAGAHQLTATYQGDASNLPGTSAPVSVTINARPDPSADPDTRSSVDSQFRTAERFARTQMDNVGNRLDQLHSDGGGSDSMNLRFSQTRRQWRTGLPGSGLAMQEGLAKRLNPFGQMESGAERLLPGSDSSVPWMPGAPFGLASNAIEGAPSSDGAMNAEAPSGQRRPFNFWASGDVNFGKEQPNGTVESRFTTTGVTVGVDGKVSDSLKLGAAFGFAWDHTRIGSNGSNNDASYGSLTFYGSWRVAPRMFIDGLVGKGYGTVDTARFSTTGSVILDGKRRMGQTFAALIGTFETRIGSVEFAPYLRGDGIWVHLSPYTETGSPFWALTFQAADEHSYSGTAGAKVRIPLDKAMAWRLTGKAEYRTRLSGGYTQLLDYADIQGANGSAYAITGQGVESSTFTGGLGLEAHLRNVMLRLNYDVSTLAGDNISNRISGAVRLSF